MHALGGGWQDRLGDLNGLSLAALRSYSVPTTRSLRQALEQPGARFIFEIKRNSPSAGPLAPDIDARVQALAFKDAADAISGNKFASATVVNGKVYVPLHNAVAVFGLK